MQHNCISKCMQWSTETKEKGRKRHLLSMVIMHLDARFIFRAARSSSRLIRGTGGFRGGIGLSGLLEVFPRQSSLCPCCQDTNWLQSETNHVGDSTPGRWLKGDTDSPLARAVGAVSASRAYQCAWLLAAVSTEHRSRHIGVLRTVSQTITVCFWLGLAQEIDSIRLENEGRR